MKWLLVILFTLSFNIMADTLSTDCDGNEIDAERSSVAVDKTKAQEDKKQSSGVTTDSKPKE